MSTYYHCRTCKWTTEASKLPAVCERCLARTVQRITQEAFLERFDAGRVAYCVPCQKIHTT